MNISICQESFSEMLRKNHLCTFCKNHLWTIRMNACHIMLKLLCFGENDVTNHQNRHQHVIRCHSRAGGNPEMAFETVLRLHPL